MDKTKNQGSAQRLLESSGLADTPFMAWAQALGSDFLAYSTRLEKYLGTTGGGEETTQWAARVHPKDRDRVNRAYAQVMTHGTRVSVDYRILCADEKYRLVRDECEPVRDARGELTGFVGIGIDLSKDEKSESSPDRGDDGFGELGELVKEGVGCWDAASGKVSCNQALVQLLGVKPTNRVQFLSGLRRLLSNAEFDQIIESARAAAAEQKEKLTSTCHLLRGDGRMIVIEYTLGLRYEAGRVSRLTVSVWDATRSLRLAEDRERFRRIVESTTDLVFIMTEGGLITYANAAARRRLNIKDNQPLGALHISACHPEWAWRLIEEEGFEQAKINGAWESETALLGADGKENPVLQVVLGHRDPTGGHWFFSTSLRDISERKKNEQANIEWYNRYAAAVRATGQVLFDWDTRTNQMTYGGQFEQVLGYTERDLEGGLPRFRELIVLDDIEEFDNAIARVLATREAFQHRFRIRRKSGNVIHLEAKGYFFLDREARIARMTGFLANVTAEWEAQQLLVRAQEELEMRVAERTAALELATSELKERAGQQEAISHLGQLALGGGSQLELFEEATRTTRSMLRLPYCTLALLRDDGTLQIAATAGWEPDETEIELPSDADSMAGYTLSASDPVIVQDFIGEARFKSTALAEKYRIQSAIGTTIRTGNEPLGVLLALGTERRGFSPDEVTFIGSVANLLSSAIAARRALDASVSAQREAEEANRAKTEFLSKMSHELRTPLNAILGFAQLLDIECEAPSQKESITHILTAGRNLLGLINEVLDIARAETGRLSLTLEPLDTDLFLAEIIALNRVLAESHGVTLELAATAANPPAVLADRHRLTQVMLNLISNAVKFNRPGGNVTVKCEATSTRLAIAVADTGHGIPQEMIKKVFIPFAQIGGGSRAEKGAGIGLALSHRIITAMNGRMGVDSVTDIGSTFWIELPLASIHSEPEQPDLLSTTSQLPAMRTILYIEDQDLNIRLIERVLTKEAGWNLLTARTGAEGLQTLTKQHPDLILLDYNLPDMTGENILREARKIPGISDIPVVVVSGESSTEHIEKFKAAGVAGYLIKPYRIEEMLRVLDEAISGSPII